MTRSIVAALAVMLLTLTASAHELQQRQAMRNNLVTLMNEGDFDAIEQLADQYRTRKERTASGLWKLSAFYDAVTAAFRHDPGDDEWWSNLEGDVSAWAAEYPKSPTPHVVYGMFLLSRGLAYRGAETTESLAPENRAQLNAYAQRARDYLQAKKAIASIDPYWYVAMSHVAAAQDWPEATFQKHLDEALAREPLFYDNYFVAVSYYAPKWADNPRALDGFAKKALQRTKSVDGSGLYARIFWAASGYLGDRLFTDPVVDWPVMTAGIDDVLKSYPDAWNIQNFARFACLAKDKAKTVELLGRDLEPPLMPAWKTPEALKTCRTWAATRP